MWNGHDHHDSHDHDDHKHEVHVAGAASGKREMRSMMTVCPRRKMCHEATCNVHANEILLDLVDLKHT